MTSEQAAELALKAIQSRSFIDRHPELGKMVKCHMCGRRHRMREGVDCYLRMKQRELDSQTVHERNMKVLAQAGIDLTKI